MHRHGLQPSVESARTQERRQHLAGVHRDRREGGLRQRHRGAQQVPGVSSFLLVLSAVFHLQLLLWQNSFIARSIARRREELKFSVPPPKQEAHPEKNTVGVSYVSGRREDSSLQGTRNKVWAHINSIRSRRFFLWEPSSRQPLPVQESLMRNGDTGPWEKAWLNCGQANPVSTRC